MKSIEELKKEHKAVLLTLDIMEAMCNKLQDGYSIDNTHIENVLEFLTVFVDKCHHGKEERILFPAMEGKGIVKDGGPIGVMLSEHDLGRDFIRAMKAAVPVMDNDKIQVFTRNALAYKQLLISHIYKEDNILYPMAEGVFVNAEDDHFIEQFDRIEENEIGEGKHEQFHQMLQELKKIYVN